MKHLLIAVSLWMAPGVVLAADRCIGAVVNGQCVGTVLPDAGNAWRNQRPPDTWLNQERGIHTSPAPSFGVTPDGSLYRRTRPIYPGGQMRWADPDELNE